LAGGGARTGGSHAFSSGAGAVSFVLLAGATAAALMLGHYAGFSSWPDLISGGKGTNAGSASLATSPNAARGHGGGTFLNIGPGSLPFAVGAAPLPLPGVAPAGPGVLVTNNGGGGPNGGGPNGGGPGNGGGPDGSGPGNGGGTPGGAVTGPGEGAPSGPEGPGHPR